MSSKMMTMKSTKTCSENRIDSDIYSVVKELIRE